MTVGVAHQAKWQGLGISEGRWVETSYLAGESSTGCNAFATIQAPAALIMHR